MVIFGAKMGCHNHRIIFSQRVRPRHLVSGVQLWFAIFKPRVDGWDAFIAIPRAC